MAIQRRKDGIQQTPETAVARFAASQIGLELAHAQVGAQDELKNLREPVRDLAQWQYESLPVGATVAEGWRVDGLIESPNDWATGWHVWDVLPDGTLMIAIAESVDRSVKGATERGNRPRGALGCIPDTATPPLSCFNASATPFGRRALPNS